MSAPGAESPSCISRDPHHGDRHPDGFFCAAPPLPRTTNCQKTSFAFTGRGTFAEVGGRVDGPARGWNISGGVVRKRSLAMSFSLAMTVAAGCQSVGDDAAPVPISGGAFGLAGRPRNTTCRPPERYTDPAATLKGTGCVDPKDPTRPAAGLIP